MNILHNFEMNLSYHNYVAFNSFCSLVFEFKYLTRIISTYCFAGCSKAHLNDHKFSSSEISNACENRLCTLNISHRSLQVPKVGLNRLQHSNLEKHICGYTPAFQMESGWFESCKLSFVDMLLLILA